MGLADQGDQQVRRLSGGQRRRLDVAVGLVGRPELLFLDEPTAGLDPQARRDFHDLLNGVVTEMQTTVLLTTHDLADADQLADRIAILVAGRVIADGGVPLGTMMFPGVLGMFVAFGMMLVIESLTADRDDGTLCGPRRPPAGCRPTWSASS